MPPLLANGSLTLAPGANASANGQLPDPMGGTRLRISNTTANLAYYKLGKDNTVQADASAACIPIPPNATIEAARKKEDTWIAVFSAAGTTVVIASGQSAGG